MCHGKAFKILLPSGSIPCSEENGRKVKKEQKRTKSTHKSKGI